MTKKEFSAGGIIIKKQGRDYRILLIKDSYGRWAWPKGNIQKSESPEEAALREITEEVGIKDLELLEKVGETKYFYKLKGQLRFKTVFIYLIEAKGNEKLKIQLEEIVDGKWFTPDEALNKLGYKGASSLLKKAIGKYEKIRRK